MHSKASLAIILIAMLLTQPLHGLKWQAMGSGMNNTVITEIWKDIGNTLRTGNFQNAQSNNIGARNSLVSEISNRLSYKWAPAWNVVLIKSVSTSDSILYGYAFNNQWMWYNGIPYTGETSNSMATLIVWKDYNCQDWKIIADGITETSTFNTAKKAAIRTEINKMTENGITNDIWGTTFTMMNNLGQNQLFSSGGYSVVMCQDGGAYIYGRVCRVGDGFYYSYSQVGTPIITSSNKGVFYLFQTR